MAFQISKIKEKIMTKKLITLIACALIIGAAMGCSKKADPEMEALKAQMQAMQAELEKAKSGNASAEEIAKLETAIAQTAEQEQRAERRRGEGGRRNRDEAAASAATTQTTPPPPPPATTATPAASTSTTTAPASTGRALVFPDGTTEIPVVSPGYGYGRYTSVTIPGSVTVIRSNAFVIEPHETSYRTITSVTIGNGVREIGTSAFASQRITSITIPNSVTTIGNSAFAGNELSGHLTIPNSVTSIKGGAFKNNKLTGVTLPNGITAIEGEPYGGVFWQNQITSVTIPDSVTSIGMFAFSTNKITSLTLSRNVREIGDQAFEGHLLTGSLVIPNSVTTIGHGAFRGVAGNNVTSLTIGNRVTSIGVQAFAWLNLTSVTIPASVRTIGDSAFQQTNPISRVTFEGDGVSLETGAFDGNLHQVYNGRGTYIRGSNGNWTKRVETSDRVTANTSLHAEPSASARVIRPINAGETVSVLHNTVVVAGGTSSTPVTATDSAGNTWNQVVYGGDEGWVRSDYLSGK
jgi:hypothetical protein